jgi:hypothetical protein
MKVGGLPISLFAPERLPRSNPLSTFDLQLKPLVSFTKSMYLLKPPPLFLNLWLIDSMVEIKSPMCQINGYDLI